MRIPVLLLALIVPSTLSAENLETGLSDYKVPCVRQSETWICAGKLSEQPDCIDVDSSRMVCTGTPAESPYRKTARAGSRHIPAPPF